MTYSILQTSDDSGPDRLGHGGPRRGSSRAPASRARIVAATVAGLFLALGGSQAEAQTRITLGDAARLAAKQNGAIDISKARVEQAAARATQRRGALFPDLAGAIIQSERTLNTATFGFSFVNPVTGAPMMRPDGELLGPVPTIDLRYRVQAPLLDLGKWGSWRAAQASTTAAGAEVNAQAEGAAAAAAATYVRAARAEAQLSARRADSTLAADLLGIARDQLQAGVGIALDVTRAESQLANVRAQIIMARNDRDRTLLELKRITGVAADASLELADSLAGLPLASALPSASEALTAALDTRADVRALKAQEFAQQQSAKAIRWERAPQLGLTVDHGVIGRNYERLLPTYTWGVQLSVGVFDGFRRESRLEEQVAAARETDARLRDLRAQSSLEVRAALLDLGSAQEQVDAVRERLRLAEQEVSQAQERFRAGVAGNADVITALLSLNQARTLRNDALAAYHGARVALAKAMGDAQKLP
ncbi:MAG TPA: TolC family protein [Gemmatimonas aurantiaca]|uniref:Outer membrane efflux protein n=2 Tax=Gemmatimonas aurantiaca TaxID=173480 RepID=C1A5R3_GEMAT|nr:TolC family protein [Gemmatimonas aurantiaca]BAH37573.1 outer membrane efflux protein [Gemmatimonas aurantiaca T-27]HCT58605.1 TolC family protein [Gemmatimonas aurantiaca]